MEWYEFVNKMYDWSESTIKTKIYQLKEVDPEELEAVMSWIGFDLSDQLIRKAMRLKTSISEAVFNEIVELMTPSVANELRAYLGMKLEYGLFEGRIVSEDDSGIEEFEKQIRAVSKKIEKVYGVKANFPEDKAKASFKKSSTPGFKQPQVQKKEINYDKYRKSSPVQQPNESFNNGVLAVFLIGLVVTLVALIM